MSSLLLQSQRKYAEHNLHLNLIEKPIELEIKLKCLNGKLMNNKLQQVPMLEMKNGKVYVFSDEKKEASLTLVKMQEDGQGLINIATKELWDFDTSQEPPKDDICHVYGPIELSTI